MKKFPVTLVLYYADRTSMNAKFNSNKAPHIFLREALLQLRAHSHLRNFLTEKKKSLVIVVKAPVIYDWGTAHIYRSIALTNTV